MFKSVREDIEDRTYRNTITDIDERVYNMYVSLKHPIMGIIFWKLYEEFYENGVLMSEGPVYIPSPE